MNMRKVWSALIITWIVFSSIYTVGDMFDEVFFPSQSLKAYRLMERNEELQRRLKIEVRIKKYEGENKRLTDLIDNFSENK